MAKKTVTDTFNFRICDICTKPTEKWVEEPMAGQDHRLKLVVMCPSCDDLFESLQE